MRILIQTISGKVHTIDVEKSTTILSIKQQIYTLEGQTILYQGKAIPETATIESIELEDGSVLHSVFNLPGS